jgi:Asp-tRNA(Asn)/Glu-tRNA(Gln) amidotransferase C subunit
MSQSHIDVRYVANLARLELSDEEVAIFQPQ